MLDIMGPTIGLFTIIGLIVFFESRRREPCQHSKTRCIHGDEINAFTKV